MRIVINALSALRGGGQVYIINFLEHLPKGNYIIFLIVNSRNKAIFDKYLSKKIIIFEAEWASKSIIHRVLWERFTLPIDLNKWNAELYYAPGGVMTTRMPKGCTSATALRNMLPFDVRERKKFPFFSYLRFKFWLLRYVFLKSYKLADKVLFISEYSRSVIRQHLPDIDSKSTVIPHGLNSSFLNADSNYDLPEALATNQFYLYVSILDAYKAQKELINTWKKLQQIKFPYPLVLVGPKYNQYGEEVIELIHSLGLQEKVIYLGEIKYEQLPSFYKAAKALIFASSCECCPNILLEKLAAGKTVFCSNIDPMPEFGQDAVVYFDPYNPEDLYRKIIDLENNQEKMRDFGKKAYHQSLQFDWEKTVQKTMEFLVGSTFAN